MTDSNRDKADEIERDIVKTQNTISETVDQLKEQLTPQSLMNSLLGDEKPGFDKIVDAAKQNPLAVALIGAGALMLASGTRPSMPSMPSFGKSSGKTDKPPKHSGITDPHHRGYVDHMGQMEMRENEPPHLYQQRRDAARANYFMLERNHEEDDTSFRKRLDDAGEALRARTATFGEHARNQGSGIKSGLTHAKDGAMERSRAVADKTWAMADDNPAVAGLVAAVVGAIVGVALPTSRVEQEKLGDVADAAMSAAADQKDKLFEKAEAQLEPAGS